MMDEEKRDKALVQDAFQKLKPTCVALLGKSHLTPATTTTVLSLLSTLQSILTAILATNPQVLTPSLISYTFFPLSTILRRNSSSAIPDQVLERVLNCITLLWEEWWWICESDADEWAQCWMLAGSVVLDLGDKAGNEEKGKRRARDEETKDAAAGLLLALLGDRTFATSSQASIHDSASAADRFAQFRTLALAKHLPLLGQTLSSLLSSSLSPHAPLQIHSLQLLRLLITRYFEPAHVPSFLPGVVSTGCKVALGREKKVAQRGPVVRLALDVLGESVVRAVGDEVCRSSGLIHTVTTLDDLLDLARPGDPNSQGTSTPVKPTNSKTPPNRFFTVPRSAAWYKATQSQLLLAFNSLTLLLSHSSAEALQGLASLCSRLLGECSLSLPDIQPLLISSLLTLSISPYPDVSTPATTALVTALSSSAPTTTAHLLRLVSNALSSLPRYLPSGLDSQIQSSSKQITAAAHLALNPQLPHLREGVARLLGPNGGIERWGLSLLYSLHFVLPPVAPYVNGSKLLEASPDGLPQFPVFELRNVTSRETLDTVGAMFRSLGRAGGEEALFAVEWSVGVGKRRSAVGVAALWVAGRMLDGVAGIELAQDGASVLTGKRLGKFCRWMARGIAELWDGGDEDEEDEDEGGLPAMEEDPLLPIVRTSGLNQIQTLLDLRNDTRTGRANAAKSSQELIQPIHASLALQLLALSSQILGSGFRTLFLQTLYPVLHALVSTHPAVSATAMCTLQVIAHSTSYASPANLLLSNFDYALDAVSHRLTRTRLDLQATAVLVVLVRVVGKDVVDKAGDVIEECFDRLDEFHGYGVLVEGLIGVLGEVISVLEADEPAAAPKAAESREDEAPETFESFVRWYQHRNDPPPVKEEEDFGPTLQEPWTNPEQEDEQKADPEEPEPSPTQALGQQIVAKSMYFLTHGSPLIRARVLHVLSSATPLLREQDLLPYVHSAWPFILNRLEDPEPFVLLEAAKFVCSLVDHAGDFMSSRIWDDVWPRFRKLLMKLASADTSTAMARRLNGAVGTESPYSTSHKLYRAILMTMREAVTHVQMRDQQGWEVGLLCRRFLRKETQPELQAVAVDLFVAIGEKNADAIWLLLHGTLGGSLLDREVAETLPKFLGEPKWDIEENARIVLGRI